MGPLPRGSPLAPLPRRAPPGQKTSDPPSISPRTFPGRENALPREAVEVDRPPPPRSRNSSRGPTGQPLRQVPGPRRGRNDRPDSERSPRRSRRQAPANRRERQRRQAPPERRSAPGRSLRCGFRPPFRKSWSTRHPPSASLGLPERHPLLPTLGRSRNGPAKAFRPGTVGRRILPEASLRLSSPVGGQRRGTRGRSRLRNGAGRTVRNGEGSRLSHPANGFFMRERRRNRKRNPPLRHGSPVQSVAAAGGGRSEVKRSCARVHRTASPPPTKSPGAAVCRCGWGRLRSEGVASEP
jgi:hypothetical protein